MRIDQALLEFLMPFVIMGLVANACSIGVILLLTSRIDGRREFWIPFAALTGPVAVLVFAVWAVYSGSLAHTMELGERYKIEKLIKQFGQRPERRDPVQEYGVDEYAEMLISNGRYEEAASYIAERLKIAHERDNSKTERVYREYQTRIEEGQRELLGGSGTGR